MKVKKLMNKLLSFFLILPLISALHVTYPKIMQSDIKITNSLKNQANKKTIIDDEKLPIVFHPNYDIGLLGIEKLHPFDSKKYGKVAAYIKKHLHVANEHFYRPQQEVSREDLEKVHDSKYLDQLKNSATVERITEVPGLRLIPNFLLQSNMLSPMRYATQGTIDAAFLALKRGIAINLSGGYHHAKQEEGGGFCVYADIPLAIKKLREQQPNLKVLYVDLDAHQGNGVESCLKYDKDTYIVDFFNKQNYPQDWGAMARINKAVCDLYCDEHKNRGGNRKGFACANCNAQYLKMLHQALDASFKEFKPDIIFYNAGTDCFEEDFIGTMALTKDGIVERDEIVFTKAKELDIPLCMTLSGGYSKKSADIIGSSIVNLNNKGLLKR